ncbi:glycoside hydrolase family 104 protein [Flavobacterium sp. B183]|uniref:glycoside hydrolase family 24 protein n=1 Tax=Flavobacterium sp. B183 TaxID=907046 RepID=UPI00201F4006|nr:glycoside hydrolase family 104 protein [Flavobacterium sp. B183]URC12543.1 glycoside hydrolase family 104 protein [Flavobacterium sp. B183]
MSKNVIHNFDILIQDSADVKSAEHLTDVMIKELAKISKEMSQQKDIEQLWQEQKSQNPSVNNSNFSAEGGVNDTIAKIGNNTALSVNNIPSVFGETRQTFNTSIGEGVADTINSTMMSTALSANTTSPILGVEEDALNLSKGVTNQIYSGVEAQQMLTIPEKLQTNGEPTLEAVKEAIRKKIEQANAANDRTAVEYWTKISKAFDENKGASIQDFDGKPNHTLFTEMYVALKQLNSVTTAQNFNWEIVREKMIKAIDTNILLGEISEGSKKRWKIIQQELQKDSTNVANLFEQYNELFLLLGQVEGLDDLPGTITITTKTKIYPNLSADRLYGKIGKEAVYVFLKEISSEDVRGSAVYRNAVKIKDTNATSFIIGESLDFFLDESLINQNLYKKEHINWIVYKKRKGKKDEETIFEDEGTSFSYNFDAEGAYIIEAYGQEHGANKKKSKKSFAFTEVKIVAQEIVILPPFTVKGRLVRPSAKEFLFKTALKHPKIKTLNPLKFYYQIETKTNNKGITISDEKELDSTGNIRLLMPDLGTYKIKVISKDQYALTQEFEVSAIKNEVTSIGLAQGESNKNVFLLGGSNKTFRLEAKTFKIPPTDEEKEDVKWIVYDSSNKPYLPSGEVWFTEKGIPKRKYFQKWESFIMAIPNKEGHYTVEAFSDIAKGVDAKATFKMEVQRPQVTEAYWAYSNGDKKETSGFSGEVNHVKAKIPGYDNQKVRISFYLNGSKEPSYYNDTTTDGSGEINKVITFDDTFQRRFGVQEGKTAKISFKLMGIQNDRLYPFKRNADVNTTAVLKVATGANITAAYFQYDGKRVTAQDEIPLSYSGEYVSIVVKTQNMIGKEIVLTSHKASKEPNFRSKVKIDSEGNASATFKITRRKGAKIGEKMSYYVGIEGHSTMHVGYKGLNMVVGEAIKTSKISSDIKLQEARIRAFLRMIRVGEGTTTNKGYEKIFGGSSFIEDYKKTWEDHPGIVIKAKGKDSKGKEKTYYSSASGAYQIKKDIWNDWGKKFREFYDIKDFSPESQDKFALVILKHKRGNDVIRLIRENKIEEAVKLCQGEWASLPDSPHGQPTVSWKTVMTEYNKFLNEELHGKSPLSIKAGFLNDLGYGDNQIKEISNDVNLRFTGSSAARADLSFKTINVLKEVASISKNYTINITSTKRASYDQARIMYENCEKTGGKYQKDEVYKDIGDKIIDVYILEAEINKKKKKLL